MMTSKDRIDDETMTLGTFRYLSDKRNIGGLLMLTGFAALVQPLASIAATINSNPDDGTTPTQGLPFSDLFGGFCVVVTGIL